MKGGANPLRLLPLVAATSPEGRGFGGNCQLHRTAKKLPPRGSCRADARLRGFAWQRLPAALGCCCYRFCQCLPPKGGSLPRRPAAAWLRAASSPSPSLLRKSTSPKGRGFGSTAKLLVLPRAPPLGELSPQVTERARTLSAALQRSSPLGRAVERMRD